MSSRFLSWTLAALCLVALSLSGIASVGAAIPGEAGNIAGQARITGSLAYPPGLAADTQTAPNNLPPIPSGLPSYFAYGLSNGDISNMPPGTPWNFRYQYLAGGANTGDGWATWNSPPGQFAVNYINTSQSSNLITVFIYYQILQSAPHYDEYANLNAPSTMYAYFDDFKLLMQKCAQAAGSNPVFVNLEPDLTGVMQQHATNTGDNAALQPASVSSSGHPDVQGIPNNFRGVYQAFARLRDMYAPNVRLGLDISPWGATDDITLVRDPSYPWQNHATRTANYLNSLGPGFQLLFYSHSDRDSAWYASQGSNRWWDDTNTTLPNFTRMAEWNGMIVQITQKRTLMWQVPNGNRVYRSVNNTNGHWQDNRPEYYLNVATGRANTQLWINHGFLGLMFGAGTGSQSHYFDYTGDGITNPPPINGNNAVALYPDDDGGYIRLGVADYYAAGPLPLPPAGPLPSPSPSRTPVPLPTGTSCQISFTDVPPDHTFYPYVRCLACRSILGGYADGTFRPGNDITRGQLAKVVANAASIGDPPGAQRFQDVPQSHTFFVWVQRLAGRGHIGGYPCGGAGEPCVPPANMPYFRPQGEATRGQIAKVVSNAAGFSNTPTGQTFEDVTPDSPFYLWVERLAGRGIMSGYPCGGANEPCTPGNRPYFRPQNNATRGQTSKIVANTFFEGCSVP
jgi:hypothetical protein